MEEHTSLPKQVLQILPADRVRQLRRSVNHSCYTDCLKGLGCDKRCLRIFDVRRWRQEVLRIRRHQSHHGLGHLRNPHDLLVVR